MKICQTLLISAGSEFAKCETRFSDFGSDFKNILEVDQPTTFFTFFSKNASSKK